MPPCICTDAQDENPCDRPPTAEDLLCDVCREGCIIVTVSAEDNRRTIHVTSEEVVDFLHGLADIAT